MPARSSMSTEKPSGMPDAAAASCIVSNRIRFVFLASLPPLSTEQLPLLRQREAICTRASGRDSKITPITPIGQVVLVRISWLSSSLWSRVLPTGSGRFIKPLMPFITSLSLCSSNLSLLIIGAASEPASALARSILLASKISDFLASRASATAERAELRCSCEREAITKLSFFVCLILSVKFILIPSHDTGRMACE